MYSTLFVKTTVFCTSEHTEHVTRAVLQGKQKGKLKEKIHRERFYIDGVFVTIAERGEA